MHGRGDQVVERRILGGRRPDQPGGEKGGDQAALLLEPRPDRLARRPQREMAERQLLGDVRALPPAGQGREVVGRHAGDRERRIGGRRQHFGALALEPQHPHPQDVRPRQPGAEPLRHRAEILADDHAPGPSALERDMADEVVERVGEIGAVRRPCALGNEEEPLKAHRMVDAQHAGVAHVGRIERAQRRPAFAGAGERIGRRQVPVLPLDGERIGRGANRCALRQRAGVRPGFGAVRRRPDGEVAVEADLEAALARPRRRPPKLTVGEPLAEERKVERVVVPVDGFPDRRLVGVAPRVRPRAPVCAGLARGNRLERRESSQRFTACFDERLALGEDRILWAERDGLGRTPRGARRALRA